MDARKLFVGTLYGMGTAVSAAGAACIAYLCYRGLKAPMRELELRTQMELARKCNRDARKEAYDAGWESGEQAGYRMGGAEGYDRGYMSAIHKEEYDGVNPVILRELGIDPDEQAKRIAEKNGREGQAGRR